MDLVLRGVLVTLRPLSEGDMRARSQWTADPELCRMMGAVPCAEPGDADDEYRGNCQWLRDRRRSGGAPYAVEADGRYIGDIDFGVYPEEGKGDLTVFLGDRRAWGKGYGTEAVRLVMDEMLRDRRIDYIEVDVAPGNDRALSFWTKLGFASVLVDEKGTTFMRWHRTPT